MTGAVGYVLKKFPRLSETFVLHEILALEEAGVPVEIFSLRKPDDGRFHPALARLRASVRYLPDFKPAEAWSWLSARAVSLGPILDRLPDALRFLAERRVPEGHRVLAEALFVVEEARRAGVGHLHAHFATGASLLAHVASRIAGLPYSFTAHAKDLYRETVDPSLFRAVADGARFVVTVCEANRTFLRETLYPGGRAPVLRLYNGVDLDLFSTAGDAWRGRRLVAIGRLVEKKGFHVLVEAIRLLREARKPVACEIVGEGEERGRLEEAIRSLDGDVRIAGALAQPAVAQRIRESSVLALPCVVARDGNRDALPTALLEALASGRPVVSTPIGGIPEIVDDGRNGVLVPPGDPASLARAIDALVSDPEAVRRMGRAGREKAEALFDLRRNVATLAGWFASPPAAVA